MMKGHFSLKIKPLDATATDYRMREVGTEVTDEEYPLPENVTGRDRSLILNYYAACNVYLFAYLDNMLTEEDMTQRIQMLRVNLRRVLPEAHWTYLKLAKRD